MKLRAWCRLRRYSLAGYSLSPGLLQETGLALWPKLDQNGSVKGIRPPQPPKTLGLQALTSMLSLNSALYSYMQIHVAEKTEIEQGK